MQPELNHMQQVTTAHTWPLVRAYSTSLLRKDANAKIDLVIFAIYARSFKKKKKKKPTKQENAFFYMQPCKQTELITVSEASYNVPAWRKLIFQSGGVNYAWGDVFRQNISESERGATVIWGSFALSFNLWLKSWLMSWIIILCCRIILYWARLQTVMIIWEKTSDTD